MNIDFKRFIVFNSSEGQDEGREHDKLLYHWTRDKPDNKTDIGEQIDDVCMCDASVTTSDRLSFGLLGSVSPDEGTSTAEGSRRKDEITGETQSLVVTFDPTVIIIVNVEPASSIWIAIHVAHSSTYDAGDQPGQVASSQRQSPDGIPTDAIKQIVRNIYDRFCLINGTFRMISDSVTAAGCKSQDDKSTKSLIRNKIRTICDIYFSSVLPAIHLSSIITNLASLYNYLVYLDLNPLTLMKVTSFINHIVSLDAAQILHTIAIFNDHLLWSSLNEEDSRQTFNYLVAVLIRDALQEELTQEVDKVRRIAEDASLYLTDCPDQTNDLNEDLARISIEDDKRTKKLHRYYMTVFRSSNNLTLGLVLKSPGKSELIQKCEQLLTSDTRLGVIPLASLAKSVGQNYLKTSSFTNTSSNLSGASASATSSQTRRKQNSSTSNSQKGQLPNDQRYLCLDKLSFSVTNSFSHDAQSRDSHIQPEGPGSEAPSHRRMRLLKYVLDLEPEMRDIQQHSGSRVEEYLGKTTSDNWLTITNSGYRCIYSIYKMRNAGLNEARQSAINLRSTLQGNWH